MTKRYYRPLVRSDFAKPENAKPIAGGWCWFDTVEVIERDGPSRLLSSDDLPQDVLERLTNDRADVAGLSMSHPQIMGILNVTPDSFSDGGQYDATEAAVMRAKEMVAEGASIIDVGGESTRPGADFIPADVESERVFAPIAGVRTASEVPISIDTRKASVAENAVKAGATLINDVSALTFDVDMTSTVADAKVPVCLMHAQGDPKTMQADPTYRNVLLDVYDFLEESITKAVASGIAREKIIVDPGIGFGKTLQHNMELLRGLSLFHGLGCPILLGASRKRFIGELGQAPDAKDRMAGSVSVALFGVSQGVQILRVHDTYETKQALDLHMAMIGAHGDGT